MNNIQEILDSMKRDQKVRTAITKRSFFFFFHLYFSHYIKYATADFQKEIIRLLEEDPTESLFVVAFRGSGKSTIITTAYTIWAILGVQQKKFILTCFQTQAQAKQHMTNLKRELESNELLKNDLGPFQEDNDEWGSYSIVFSNTKSRITAVSTEQSIRGIRNNQYRPDCILCDDVEDISSTRTIENRNKTSSWLRQEIIPLGDISTRLIIVGNLLHEDSLLMRIKDNLEDGTLRGQFRYYPLLDNEGNCAWPGKYPTPQDIEEQKRKIGDEKAWQREFELKIVPEDGQIIHRKWIQYYSALPDSTYLRQKAISVDLAISQKESADFTAIICANIYRINNEIFMYILPNVINKRMDFPTATDTIKNVYNAMEYKERTIIILEENGMQMAYIQDLQRAGYPAKGYKTGSSDKASRLTFTTLKIKSGHILFPKEGCEQLINQIVNFGTEKHDDMVDAFSMLNLYISSTGIIPSLSESIFVI